MSWERLQDYKMSTEDDFWDYEERFTFRYTSMAVIGIVAVAFLLVFDRIGEMLLVLLLWGLYVHLGGAPKISIVADAEPETNTRWLVWKNKKCAISLERYEDYSARGGLRDNRPLSRSWIVAPEQRPNLSTYPQGGVENPNK